MDEDRYRGHAAGLVDARFGVPPYPDSSFFNPGGLAVIWAEENARDSLFEAMLRRETYGTSGPRMLLWFDLLNPPGSRGRTRPMGSAVEMSDPPIFRVRAVGSFEQKPGCPDYVTNNLTPKSIDSLHGVAVGSG